MEAVKELKEEYNNQLRLVKKDANKLKVLKIQRTCVHDGPGIELLYSLRGRHLRYIWCQNPEVVFESPAGDKDTLSVK